MGEEAFIHEGTSQGVEADTTTSEQVTHLAAKYPHFDVTDMCWGTAPSGYAVCYLHCINGNGYDELQGTVSPVLYFTRAPVYVCVEVDISAKLESQRGCLVLPLLLILYVCAGICFPPLSQRSSCRVNASKFGTYIWACQDSVSCVSRVVSIVAASET